MAAAARAYCHCHCGQCLGQCFLCCGCAGTVSSLMMCAVARSSAGLSSLLEASPLDAATRWRLTPSMSALTGRWLTALHYITLSWGSCKQHRGQHRVPLGSSVASTQPLMPTGPALARMCVCAHARLWLLVCGCKCLGLWHCVAASLGPFCVCTGCVLHAATAGCWCWAVVEVGLAAVMWIGGLPSLLCKVVCACRLISVPSC